MYCTKCIYANFFAFYAKIRNATSKAKAELSTSKKPIKAEEEKAENAKQKPVEVRPIPLVDKFKNEINAEPFIMSGVILAAFALLVAFLIFA